jgi:Arc/MetJ family transcription regulator
MGKNYAQKRLMRSHIGIDPAVMCAAMKCGSFKTKREAVEAALRVLVQTKRQARIRTLRGRLKWEGALDDMRRDA